MMIEIVEDMRFAVSQVLNGKVGRIEFFTTIEQVREYLNEQSVVKRANEHWETFEMNRIDPKIHTSVGR